MRSRDRGLDAVRVVLLGVSVVHYTYDGGRDPQHATRTACGGDLVAQRARGPGSRGGWTDVLADDPAARSAGPLARGSFREWYHPVRASGSASSRRHGGHGLAGDWALVNCRDCLDHRETEAQARRRLRPIRPRPWQP